MVVALYRGVGLTRSDHHEELISAGCSLIDHRERFLVRYVGSVDIIVDGCISNTLSIDLIRPVGVHVVRDVWVDQEAMPLFVN